MPPKRYLRVSSRAPEEMASSACGVVRGDGVEEEEEEEGGGETGIERWRAWERR